MDFLFVYTYIFTYVHLLYICIYQYIYLFFHVVLLLTVQVILNAFSIGCHTLHTRPFHELLFVMVSCVLINRRYSIYLYRMFSILLCTIGIHKIIPMLQTIERNHNYNNCIVHNIITRVCVLCYYSIVQTIAYNYRVHLFYTIM